MGNNSTWICIAQRITYGVLFIGVLGSSWVLLGHETTVPTSSISLLEAPSTRFESTREISTPNLPSPENVPAAPGGAAVDLSSHDDRTATPARTTLQVYCSPSSFRLIAARLERAFELAQPHIDLVLHVETDRNCVGHLLMGTANVAMIGSKLSTNERRGGLDSQVLGHQIMVPVVHADNPVISVNFDDFRSMLNGNLTGWSRVGGQHLKIEPVCMVPPQRRDLAADTLRFDARVAGSTTYLHSDQEILGYVSNNPRALGLVSKTSADYVKIVRVVQVDQIAPNLKFFKQGGWRFGSTFRAVHHKDPEAGTLDWLEFLDSDPARKIIRRVMTPPEE